MVAFISRQALRSAPLRLWYQVVLQDSVLGTVVVAERSTPSGASAALVDVLEQKVRHEGYTADLVQPGYWRLTRRDGCWWRRRMHRLELFVRASINGLYG